MQAAAPRWLHAHDQGMQACDPAIILGSHEYLMRLVGSECNHFAMFDWMPEPIQHTGSRLHGTKPP